MARKIVLILGLFIALLPYLGFPESLIATCSTIAGLLVAFLAWSGKRPSSASTIEDMEGELHSAVKEDETPSVSVQQKKVEPKTEVVQPPQEVPKTYMPETTIVAEPAPLDNKVVSVAFTKQRVRNLKKRITQEGVPPQP